jgi:hypothetical protein
MKYMKVIALILTLLKICSAALPKTGNLVMRIYQDKACTTPLAKDNIATFDLSVKCWKISDTLSILPVDYDLLKQSMTISVFMSKDCTGTSLFANAPLPADGSCIADALVPGRYISNRYVNLPGFNFQYKEYSDATCSTSNGISKDFAKDQFCWATSDTTSVTPLSWDNTLKALSYDYYGNSNSCFNRSGLGILKCDQTCTPRIEKLGTFYKCSNSAYLMVSLFTLAILALLF